MEKLNAKHEPFIAVNGLSYESGLITRRTLIKSNRYDTDPEQDVRETRDRRSTKPEPAPNLFRMLTKTHKT